MRLARHVLLLVLAFLLQTTWVHFFQIAAVGPDLILLVMVYIALTAGQFEAIILGFCIGFVQDSYAPEQLGVNALAKCLVGYSVGYGRLRIMADSPQVQTALIFGAVLLHDAVYYVTHSGIPWGEVPYFWGRYSLGRALYTALAGGVLAYGAVLRRRFLPV
jgi:rod shape-determining protein MreD